MNRICSVDDCGRPHCARGYCKNHYYRLRRRGELVNLDPAQMPTASDRFWPRVAKADPDACWPWTGQRDIHGYGDFRISDTQHKGAHRFAYEDLVGPVPEGLHLDHTCRVRHCVNPAHLEPVTPAENTRRGVGPAAVNARKSYCPEGHEYDYVHNGKRYCRTCRREAVRRYALRKRCAVA